MHIGFVTTEYAGTGQVDGGLGNYLVRITRLLQEHGHECEVFVCNGNDLPRECTETIDMCGVRVHILSHRLEDPLDIDMIRLDPWMVNLVQGAWSIAEAVEARHRIKPFDVIQVPSCGIPGIFLDLDVPLVLRLSHYERDWHIAYGFTLNREAALFQILDRQNMFECDVVYSPSKYLARKVGDELDLRISVIRPPAYLECIKEEWDSEWANTQISGHRYFVFVGSVSRMKGCGILARALPEVLRLFPDVHMHFIGREIPVEIDGLYELTREFGTRIHMHGSQPHARVYPMVAGAMALVAPSLIENLPNTVIEAGLLGVPVVGTRNTSIEEIIEPNVGGFLVEPNDVTALARTLTDIAELSNHTLSVMGRDAQSYVNRMLAPDQCLPELLDLYRNTKAHQRIPRSTRLARLRLDASTTDAAMEFEIKKAISPFRQQIEQHERLGLYPAMVWLGRHRWLDRLLGRLMSVSADIIRRIGR